MIEAKIAALIDNRTLIINKGAEDGVQVGMKFSVRSDQTAPVLDPDSGAEIMRVPLEKTVVKIIETSPHGSTGRTFRTIPGRPGFSATLQGTPARDETFETDGVTIRDQYRDETSRVNIGDSVVQVREG